MNGITFRDNSEESYVALANGQEVGRAAAQCTIEYGLVVQNGIETISATNITGSAVKSDGWIEIEADTLLHIRLAAGIDWKFDTSGNPVELDNSSASAFYQLVSVDPDGRGVVIEATLAPAGTNIAHSLISHVVIANPAGGFTNKIFGNTIGNPPRIE